MTKTFCDICMKEKTVEHRKILVRTDISGNPIFKVMDVCDDCYSKIIKAQINEFQKIQNQAKEEV